MNSKPMNNKPMNNKPIVMTLTIVNIALWFLTGGEAFYGSSIFLIALIVVNYLIIRLNIKRIYSSFVINSDKYSVGDNVRLDYILVNKGLIPVHFAKVNLILTKEFGESEGEEENLYFKPSQIITLKRRFTCKKRGFYTVGNLKVTVRDVLGIFSRTKVIEKPIKVKVYPKIYDLKDIKRSHNNNFGAKDMKNIYGDDYTNIRSIREYRYGDNVKNIHYKLSAKSDKVYTKQYSHYNEPSTLILLNGSSTDYSSPESEDSAVDVCASILKHYVDLGTECILGLMNGEGSIKTIGTQDNHNSALEDMIGFRFDDKLLFSKAIANTATNIAKGSLLAIVTGRLSEEVAAIIGSLLRRGVIIDLYLLEKDIESETIAERIMLNGSLKVIWAKNKILNQNNVVS